MEIIFFFAIYLFFGGACLYVLFCANPNGKGPIAALHRLVFTGAPAYYRYIQLYPGLNQARRKYAPRILGKRVVAILDSIFHYFFYRNHPIIQTYVLMCISSYKIFYIIIVSGGLFLYFKAGFLVLYPSNHISSIHIYTGTGYVFVCLYIYYRVCVVEPGVVTKSNVDEYIKKYEYDGHLFIRNNVCTTCKTLKPARSKHCKICDVCVSKFDHHCIWVKQCIGEKNYKWFVTYIFSHSILCFYAVYVGTYLLYGVFIDNDLLNKNFRIEKTGKIVKSNWYVVLQYFFIMHGQFLFVLIVCLILGIALLIFTITHLKTIAKGRTTAENIKVNQVLHEKYKKIRNLTTELQELKKNKKSAKEEEAIKKKIDELENEMLIVDDYGKKGFKENLKEVFRA